MGLRGIIASVVRVVRGATTVSEVRVDSGGSINATGEQYGPPGDDSQPLPGDVALLQRAEGTTGGYDTVGYIDPDNAPQSDPGERRLYARDTTGAIVATVWLKNDGTVLVENAAGSMELLPDGRVDANGAIIRTSGDVEVPYPGPPPGLVVSLVNHVHPGSGSPPTPTPPAP